MQSTRRKILDHLEGNAPATARTISKALRMTVANVRHHIGKLEEDGLVEVVGKRAAEGRGRPTYLYGLTTAASKSDFRLLTKTLWVELLGDTSLADSEYKLDKLAERMTPSAGSSGGSLTQRLYQAVRQLRTLKYDARWEAHAQSPLIILQQCPFAGLQPDLPEICKLDEKIISRLIGQSVEQVAMRNYLSGSDHNCIFRVLPEQHSELLG